MNKTVVEDGLQLNVRVTDVSWRAVFAWGFFTFNFGPLGP